MEDTYDRQDILLESGTNEVEILEFYLRGQSFAVNVAKVLQIIAFDGEQLVDLPETEGEALSGMYVWRDATIPFIDLYAALRLPECPSTAEKPLIIITEFNKKTSAFLVDGVNRIHRLSWQQIQPTSEFINVFTSRITGSLNIADDEILIVDFEHILAELMPETRLNRHIDKESESLRQESEHFVREKMKLVMAEDSSFLRNMLKQVLTDVGYSQLKIFDNGESAYEYIRSAKKECEKTGGAIHDKIDILVTDIEMPRMDGLTLCRQVKEELGLKNIPVVVFSSLINEQMQDKCRQVGAATCIAKPDMGKLVEWIDDICEQFALSMKSSDS